MVTQPIPSSYIRVVARELESDVTLQQLLAGTGLDETSLSLADSVSLDQLLAILRNAGHISNNPAIGLQLGSLLHPSTHGSVGWATINSPTLGDAVDVLCRYSRLQVPFIKYETSISGDWFCVRIIRLKDLEDQQRVLTECALLLLHQVVSYSAGHTLTDAEATLDYPQPDYGDDYATLLQCDVTFDGAAVEYRFPREYANLPGATANDDMYEIALDQCRNAEHRIQNQGDLIRDINDLLKKHIEEHLTLNQVAYRLNVSPRTLIRRLKKRDSSFKLLSDGLYAQTAADYMKRTDISVNAVSQLLGYRDPANFRRSFKRWFNRSPSDYRAQKK